MDTSVTIFSLGYIIILIVPGIIFKRFFFQGAFSGQFNSGLFADRIITSLFWGILVQIISALTFSRIINITYEDWRSMVQTFYQNLVEHKLPNITAEQLVNVLFYAVYSVALAATLGYFLYKTIRWFNFDLKFPAFRFSNNWHYYFKGEILGTPEFKGTSRGKVISTEVDLMLKTDDGKSNLFSGLLTDYTLKNCNELDAIYLTGATRFSLTQKSNKQIPGDIFIIPMSTVQNLNIRYNFEVRRNRPTFKYIMLFISAILLLLSITYPWFIEIGIWRKIFGCLTLFISWMFFSSLTMSFFPPSSGSVASSIGAKATNFVVLVVMLVISNQILSIIPEFTF